jgi:4'-phosphopantetheinyl transferase
MLGKPALVNVPRDRCPSFNLSHSGDLALLAVASGRDVGVDVEQVQPIADADAIAEHYFCARERDTLRQIDGEARMALFYTYWTRKEAILKATGDGLSLPLDQVDVSTVSGERAEVVSVLDGSGAIRDLAIVDLDPAIGYASAVAVEGVNWRYACWCWQSAPELCR